MMMRRARATPRPRIVQLWWAVLSGILLGCAFPPVDCKPLVWVGLVPLLWVTMGTVRPRQACAIGYTAGLVFFLLTLHPLVSAHSWTGWAAESPAAFAHRMSRQWWFMQGIWIAFALWCALFWAAWAWVLRALAVRNGWRMLVLAPALWVLLPEWARAQTTFGFTWAFLGNAAADLAAIRQAAAAGGVWLLSALIVVFSAGLAHILMGRQGPARWRPLAVALGLVVVVWVGGAVSLRRPRGSANPVEVAALQRHKVDYQTSDFSASGFDRSYAPMVEAALQRGARLVVLPESIALGVVSLDGSPSQTKPPEWQHARSAWDAQMAVLLKGTPAVLIIGLDTVEQGRDHNTLVAWNAHRTLGWYHKQQLVPFSEYQPWGWGPWAIRGRSQYVPGHGSQLIRVPGAVLGGFICQELLFPWVTRQSVRDGATVLVSGGNDGVFGDPAVAQVHADAAQLRAVETGRFVVRAMKTGISAIIDPHGQELLRSQSSEPVMLRWAIEPHEEITPYVRFGDWVVWVSLALSLWGAVTAFWRPPSP